MLYLTGSRAAKFWFDNFDCKPNTDWDIVSDRDLQSQLVDQAPQGLLSYEICKNYSSGFYVETPIGIAEVVRPECLMLFKRSHLHRPLSFKKHIRHYHFLKDRVNIVNHDVYNDLLKKRISLTKQKYGDKVPSLRKKTDEFFDDYVTKKYKHDDIHYATCYGERPIYEELKTDSQTVWCSQAKWNSLTHTAKVNCVREEAFVIALERYLIPKPTYPAKFAFNDAVERICTTLTSGWFRDFAIDNWPTIVDCDYNFVGKFLSKGFSLGV